MYYCYILYSEKLDKFYIGSTANIEGRIQRHNSSNNGFTLTDKPCKLKYYEEFKEKKAAMQSEIELKCHKSRKPIELLIGD